MSKTYRVAIAGSDHEALQAIQDLLTRLGHRVTARAACLRSLIHDNGPTDFELVICDLTSHDGRENLKELISSLSDVPVIITSNDVDAELLESSVAHQVFGVLSKPPREHEMAVAIVVAAQRHQEFRQLRDETCSLRAALEDRKLIEQAKGVLMKKCSLDEAGAFRHLQHLARQHRQKVVDVAKGILIAEVAFLPVQSVPISPTISVTDIAPS